MVQAEISGGVSSITGNFTAAEADQLLALRKSRPLPFPDRIVSESIQP